MDAEAEDLYARVVEQRPTLGNLHDAIKEKWLLLFPDPPLPAEGPPPSGVAVVLTRHEQQALGGERDRVQLSTRVLAEVLDRTGDERVTVLSTVQGLGGLGLEDDSEVAAAAVAALEPSRQWRVDTIDGYVGPRAVVDALARHRAVVGQRGEGGEADQQQEDYDAHGE